MGSDASSLIALPCALCGFPVAHYDPTIIGSRVGGLCSRATCRTDPRNGTRRQVYTFAIVVGWPAYAAPPAETPMVLPASEIRPTARQALTTPAATPCELNSDERRETPTTSETRVLDTSALR